MTDRELLELAAKAHGGVQRTDYSDRTPDHWKVRNSTGVWVRWNPLEDDGDALRLAVRLQISVLQWTNGVSACHAQTNREFAAPQGDKSAAATRWAIVRAAAEIGKAMP